MHNMRSKTWLPGSAAFLACLMTKSGGYEKSHHIRQGHSLLDNVPKGVLSNKELIRLFPGEPALYCEFNFVSNLIFIMLAHCFHLRKKIWNCICHSYLLVLCAHQIWSFCYCFGLAKIIHKRLVGSSISKMVEYESNMRISKYSFTP